MAQFCDDLNKISTKFLYPQNIFIFLKLKFKILNTKNGTSLRMYDNIRVPPPPRRGGGGGGALQ